MLKDRYLFRGKRVDNGEWVYGSLITFIVSKNGESKNYAIKLQDAFNTDCEHFFVYKKTIGQYTGLKDKNGVKIFEGDYLHMPGYYCEVVFCDGGFHTVYKHPEDGEILPILDLYLNQMEIIGSVHDD